MSTPARGRPRALAVMSAGAFELLFDDARRARLARLAEMVDPPHVEDIDDPALGPLLGEVEVLLTSWGAPLLDATRLDRMPRLRAVLHAAGSVRPHLSDDLWSRDIRVTSAAYANAVPVAEYTLAAILFAGKRALVHVRTPQDTASMSGERIGNFGRVVGIVGFSHIGRLVVDLLRRFEGMTVLVADPFADAGAVSAAGAALVPLDELLRRADVLSLHAPALPATRHLIGAAQLGELRDGATVINTARGWLLDHDALLAECRAGRLDAVLDVTEPEPLPETSQLRQLPNVAITPHLAGSRGAETRRMTDAALDELEAYAAGDPPRHPVRREDLDRIA